MKKLSLIFALFLSGFAGDLDYKSLSSDFKQSVASEGKAIMYTGNFVAQAKNAYWHYQKPNVKNIYFYGDEVVIIEPDLEQAIYTKLKDIPDLAGILRSATKKSENRYEANFDGILYKVTMRDGKPAIVEYTDKLDNVVRIELSNVKINENIADSEIFKPRIPKGYDIVTN